MAEQASRRSPADEHDALARRMVDAARAGSGLTAPEAGRLIRALAGQATAPELLAVHLAFLAAAAEDRATRAVSEPVDRLERPPVRAVLGKRPPDHADPRDLVDAWREVAAVLESGDGTPYRLDEHDTQGAINVLMLDLPHDDGAERLRSRADWIESGADAGTGPLHRPADVADALRRVSDRVER
jgi:hypothetical protein